MQSTNPSAKISLAIIAILMLGTLRAQAQSYVFGTASYSAPLIGSISAGQANSPTVTADFNGDGIPDLAVLGNTAAFTPVISIYLGKPDGTFAPRMDYPLPSNESNMPGFTVGDFNGDGKLDIIVVSGSLGPTASIFLGNGDGTLQSSVPINLNVPTGLYSYGSIASADLNGDGKLDLIIIGNDPTLVLLGNGDTTFQPATSYPGVSGPYLAIGDFNGDGKPDLAITGTPTSGQPGMVSVLINQGDGTFQSPVNYTVAGSPLTVAAADMNRDGKLDLVVPVYISQNSGTVVTGGVSVLLGIGDGTFASAQTHTSSLLTVYPTSLVVADFNGDGNLDLAMIKNVGGDESVSTLFGNGNGTFQDPPVICNGGLNPKSLVALDANGDGKPDLVAVGGDINTYSANSLTVVLNRGDGSFSGPSTYSLPQYPEALILGDFNGDGKQDIAASDLFSNAQGQPNGGAISTSLGNGDGTFQSHVDTSVSNWPLVMAGGDFNNDGKLDLVVGYSTPYTQYLSTFLGNGDGTFQSNITQAVTSIVRALAVGDFNRDGKLDVAAVIDGTNAVSIFLGRGDGTFCAPVQYATAPLESSAPLLVGDFNQDGILDLAVAADSYISILLGKGDGTFQAHQDILPASPGLQLIAVADFNGDGKPDLALAGITQLTVALGNGDGTFQLAQAYALPSILNVQAGVAGDFNGDGKLDFALASQGGPMTILIGNGDGTFQRSTEYWGSASGSDNFMVASDFNGDGALDIATLSNYALAVYLNSPIAAFAPRALVFGSEMVGESSSQETLTLTNPGAAPVVISSIVATGDFSATNDCGATLAIGAKCHINVTFEPTGVGERTGALTFTDNASVVAQIIPLSGTGGAPNVSLSPGTVSFPNESVGATSAAQPITLRNNGQTAVAITSISTNGDFAQTNTCGSNLGAGNQCTISVTFTPTSPGSLTGDLTVDYNQSGVSGAQSVTLSGTGIAPAIAWSAPNLAFGSHPVQATSAALAETVTNSGSANLTLSTVTIAGTNPSDFSKSADTCTSATVTPNGTCTVSVTFTPSAVGSRSALLNFSDNASGSPQSVALTGTGTGPIVGLSGTSLTFSGQLSGTISAAQTVTLNNTGNAALSITSIAASGDFAQTNNCGSSMAAGGSCTINATFRPTQGGSRTGAITFTDNAPGSPQSVALTGTGEDFTIGVPSGGSSTASVSPGGTASYTLSFSGLGSMSQTVNFACTGAPSEATCTVNPTAATPDVSSAVSVKVTTTAPSRVATRLRHPPPGPGRIFGITLLFFAVLVMMLVRFTGGRRYRKPLRWAIEVGAVTVVALSMAACGGGGGGGTAPPSNPGTPAGSYTLTVTGTAGTGSTAVSHKVTLTLNVS